MADATKIEWTHRPGTKGCTWNPIRAENTETGKLGWYCEHESHACDFCYAEAKNCNTFFGNALPYKPKTPVRVFLDEKILLQPLRWRAPRTIFVCSMTDIFGRWVKNDWLDKIFAIAALCPQHTFIILTKRARRMKRYFEPFDQRRSDGLGDAVIQLGYTDPLELLPWPLPNVWLGVTAEDQETADARVPLLLATPAAIRFVSCEPLLGPIDLKRLGSINVLKRAMPELVARYEREARPSTVSGMQIEALGRPGQATIFFQTPDHMGGFAIQFPRPFPRLDWVICGGETGKYARPMHPDWARSLRDQCAAAGVPFFFKQWGEWAVCTETQRPAHAALAEDGTWAQGEEAWGIAEHYPDHVRLIRIGQHQAGRLLDGVEHNEFPRAA